MSAKNRDNKNRWRNVTVGFRVSPEESEKKDRAVRLSGLTKQDYITRRLLCQDVVVQGNPGVYKALRNELAAVMERYGIEWEQKGTHEKHLSVLDYKKQERAEEIEQLESKIIDKQTEFEMLSKRIQNFDKGTASLSQMQNALENAPEYQLPEPQGFMTAKSYKSKVVVPLIKRLKSLIKTLMVRCFQAIDDYQRLNQTNASLYHSNEKLKTHNKQIDSLLEQAR